MHEIREILRSTVSTACLFCAVQCTNTMAHDRELHATVLWRHISDGQGCEIACYSPIGSQLFVTDGDGVAVLDALTGRNVHRIPAPPGFHPTSVTHSGQKIAVAWAATKTESIGRINLYSAIDAAQGKVNTLSSFAAGYLPDMVVFSPDGHWLLAANEGEPTDDYQFDPPGTITAIEIHDGPAGAIVHQLDFEEFNARRPELRRAGVLITGPSTQHEDGQAIVSEDLEPEYIAVSADSKQAWISLQENNAIAELDLTQPRITSVYPLGLKNFRHRDPQVPTASAVSGAGLDASDCDGGARIRHWPVFGMYQPDAIGFMEHDGTNYLLTVNEGDPRKYTGFDQRTRVDSLLASGSLDTRYSARFATSSTQLGRLEVASLGSNLAGSANNCTANQTDAKLDRICCFGARSFSVWSVPTPNSIENELKQVFDSGNEFESISAQVIPSRYNADSTPTSAPDVRSTKRGPEPEGLAIGRVGTVPLAAIGLERTGGVMLYDISLPSRPTFVEYILPLDRAGRLDCAPEGLVFIPAGKSPTGNTLLVVCNEGSHTVTAYELAWR